jgi:hypothetical protein
MTFAESVLGRREPRQARSDLVCGITAARLTFEVELGLAVRAAAIAFDPTDSSRVAHFECRLDELLASIVEDTGAVLVREDDDFGFRWITLSGASLDDLALSIGMLAELLDAAGCWERLACAVFACERKTRISDPPVFWIYNFERGGFYPFAPRSRYCRDAQEELRLRAAVVHELRLEPDPQRCFPLWDVPIEWQHP